MERPKPPGSKEQKATDTEIGVYILKLDARGEDCSNRLNKLGELFNGK